MMIPHPGLMLALALGATSKALNAPSDAEAMELLRKPLPDPGYRRESGGGMIWSPLPPKRCTACNGPANDWHDRCAACRAKGPIDWPCPQCNVKAGEPCRGGRGRKPRKELHAARVKVARGGR